MDTDSYSTDSFQRGRFWLTQPRLRGHRSGIDSLLLAAAVPSDLEGRVADFGSGAGAAGLSVVARCSKVQVVLIENMPEMVFCAQQTLKDERNAILADRASILQANLYLTGKERTEQGLENDSFDFVIMNPPFNSDTGTESSDDLRRMARSMPLHLPESWMRCAAAVLKPKGSLAAIIHPAMLPEFMKAMGRRFGSIMIIPVYSRQKKPAIRIIIRALQGTKAVLSLLPPVILYEGDSGKLSSQAQAISEGRQALFET